MRLMEELDLRMGMFDRGSILYYNTYYASVHISIWNNIIK